MLDGCFSGLTSALFLLAQAPPAPGAGTPSGAIIVKLADPPSELSTLSDVLLGSLGLSGVLALFAILLGVALGGVMFWIKQRRET